MNDYTKYKIKQSFEHIIDGFFAFIFFVPRKLYKENEKFKNYILNIESKSRKKQAIRRCLSKIFYDLDHNSDGVCTVYTNTRNDYWYDGIDRADYNYKMLLEDDKWIIKNKLIVEKKTLYEYVKENQKDVLYSVCDYNKDDIVMIIRRM